MADITNEEATVIHKRPTPKFFLKGVSDAVADKVYPLIHNTTFGKTVLGRDESCHIVLNESGISRKHAAFHVQDSAVWVEDLRSANGTFIDQVMVQQAELKPGQIIAFDQLQFRLDVIGDVVRQPSKSPFANRQGQPSAQQTPTTPQSRFPWGTITLVSIAIIIAVVVGYSLRSFSG